MRSRGQIGSRHRIGTALTDHQGRCSCGRQPVLRVANAPRDGQRPMLSCPLRVERSSAKNPRRRAERCRPVTGQKVMLRPYVEFNSHRCHSNIASRGDAALAEARVSHAPRAHPYIHSQPGLWSPRSASPLWRQGAAARQPASKRLFNAQQNAHRCDSSGGDPGGRSAWPTRGGVRLRVGQP